jgi:hypothetical protein
VGDVRGVCLIRQIAYQLAAMSASPSADESCVLWDQLHTAALNDYGFPGAIPPEFLYHPPALGEPLP